jgi:hypothetical protein
MTFTPNIPSTGQSLGQTKNLISGNFTNYFNTTSQDHVAPNGALGNAQGKHNQSTYCSQGIGASKSPVTLATEVAMYSGTDSFGTMQLFAQQANQALNAGGIQMSRLDIGAAITNLGQGKGYSFLPGGFIIQWGIAAATTGAGTVTTFPIIFPNYCYGVTLGIVGASITSLHSVWVKTNYPANTLAARTQFNAASDSGALGCFFIAIGN